MRHAIVTGGDARVGDFIADHWARSLREVCDLTGIDALALDYGMTPGQRQRLDAAGVERIECRKDAHPANIRFRDAAKVLAQRGYANALVTDGGDLIFQRDVSHLLRRPLERMAAYREPVPSVVWSRWKGGSKMSDYLRQLQERYAAEPTVNAGVLLGPAGEFQRLWRHISEHTAPSELAVFGVDQILISDYLLHAGFDCLEHRYNFMPWACPFGVRVCSGQICDGEGVIPVVHNSGGYGFARPFARFGYGPGRNRKKRAVFAIAGLFGKGRRSEAAA